MRLGSSKGRSGGASDNSRRATRHQTNLLTCQLGDVADISRTGMRIKCPSRPPVKVDQMLQLKLESTGQRIAVLGRVVWVRRKGLKAYQIGVQFVNVKSSVAAALESLALFGFVDVDAAAAAKHHGANEAPSPAPTAKPTPTPGAKERPREQAKTVRAAVSLPDYYEILGVPPTATAEDIQHAYRGLALKYHPDVNGDPSSVEQFMRIKDAYEVLRNDRDRKSYDRSREKA
jgi:hypothetical protein